MCFGVKTFQTLKINVMRLIKYTLVGLLFLMFNSAFSQSLAEQLGFKPTDKILIITAEDAGLCNATNEAIIQVFQRGTITGTSIMAPCPWSLEMIDFAKRNQNYSYGLQLTLTSDYKNLYTWRPIASADKVPSLLNDKGMMLSEMTDLYKTANIAQVETELRAQIEWAKKCGLPINYLTSHLEVLTYNQSYFDVLVKLAGEYGFPIRFLNNPNYGNDIEAREKALQAKGILHPDNIIWNELDSIKSNRDVKPVLETIIRNLKPGVTELFVHPSILSPEIKNLTRNYSRKVEEYEWLINPDLLTLLKQNDIKLISYKELYKLQQTKKQVPKGK